MIERKREIEKKKSDDIKNEIEIILFYVKYI